MSAFDRLRTVLAVVLALALWPVPSSAQRRPAPSAPSEDSRQVHDHTGHTSDQAQPTPAARRITRRI
jgi:hypothetical protein